MLDYEEIKANLLGWISPEPPSDRDLELADALGHGDYEIYTHKIDAALDEARTVFVRTGVSSMLKSGDLVVGVHNAGGDLVAASCGTYLHAPLAQLPVKFLIDHYIEGGSNVDVNPGDIFYANEALAGGLHNPDQMAIMPIFAEGDLIGWATAALHQPETGAIEPGGMPQTAKTRYDEGMRLTPIKLAEDYEIREDLMDMMVNFVSRSPRMQEIDVRARCTAVDKLRERVAAMAEDAGADAVRGTFRRMIDESANATRSRIESWPDGTFRATGFYDTAGADIEALLKMALTVRKRGDEVELDFTGTSPECGSYNSFGHGVVAFMAAYLHPYVFSDLPVSSGVFAPFDFEIPEGCALNASPEISVTNCIFIGRLSVALCHDAFTRMLYGFDAEHTAVTPAVQAGSSAFSGVNQYGVPETDMSTFTLNTDGAGARHDMDGVDAHGFFFAPWGKATNVEDRELSRMFIGLTRRHLADSHGFGKRRGGSGTQNVNLLVSDEPVYIDSRGIGSKFPYGSGMFGGYGSTAFPRVLLEDTDVLDRLAAGEDVPRDVREIVRDREIDADYRFERINHENFRFDRGDVVVNLCGGGGGLGDPLDRDPDAVRRDVEEGVLTEWAARHVYGVDPGADDSAASERREAVRADRLDRGRPYDEFEDEWSSKRPPDEIMEYYGEWPDGMTPRPAVAVPSDD